MKIYDNKPYPPIWCVKGFYGGFSFKNSNSLPYIELVKPRHCLAVLRGKQRFLKHLGL